MAGPCRSTQPEWIFDQGGCGLLLTLECRLHRSLDRFFLDGLSHWLSEGSIDYDLSYIQPFTGTAEDRPPSGERLPGRSSKKATLGVFDEGCMGMFNAIVPDHLLHATGIFKERLRQSGLAYATGQIRMEKLTMHSSG